MQLIVALALIAAVLFAGVVLAELSALVPDIAGSVEQAPLLVPIQAARIPLRLGASGAIVLLVLAAFLRGRRLTLPARAHAADAVIEPETFSTAAKRALLVLSGLTSAAGGLALFGVQALWASLLGPMGAAIALAFVVGGVIALIQLRASLAGTSSRRFSTPASWILALAFPLVISAGEIVRRSEDTGIAFVVFLLVGAALPPLTALAMASEAIGLPPSRRRVLLALVAGGTLSVIAALVLEVLLPGIVALLALPLGELIRDVIAMVDQGGFSDLLKSPLAILLFVELAVVAPIVEEAVKPLAVIILGRRIQHRRDAMLLGMAAGAGFAIIENIGYEGGALHLWTGVAIVRGLGGALHPFGAGLVALGWFGVFQGEPAAWKRLARFYLIAVGVHALWNGASATFVLLESASRGVFGPVDLLGIIIDVGLLSLLAAEGLALLWAAREIARSLAVDATLRPPLQPTHALAVWGIACLAVLLPVAVAAGHSVVRFLAAALGL